MQGCRFSLWVEHELAKQRRGGCREGTQRNTKQIGGESIRSACLSWGALVENTPRSLPSLAASQPLDSFEAHSPAGHSAVDDPCRAFSA